MVFDLQIEVVVTAAGILASSDPAARSSSAVCGSMRAAAAKKTKSFAHERTHARTQRPVSQSGGLIR